MTDELIHTGQLANSYRLRSTGTSEVAPGFVPVAAAVAHATYRSTVTSADVVAVPGTVTCTKQAGGSATAGVYTTYVIAGNVYGRTTGTAGNVTVTTETTNPTVRAAFSALTGAPYDNIS